MARGGYRPGAGRPKGAKSTAPTERQVDTAERTLQRAPRRSKKFRSAAEFAMHAINDPDVPLDAKVKLTQALLPFQSPKVAAGGLGKKDAAQQAAKTAGAGSHWGDLLDTEASGGELPN